MDQLTLLALIVVALGVWAYITYQAVRRGVRDALRETELRSRSASDSDSDSPTRTPE